MKVVLDASALLALLHNEPGADRVMETLDEALVSAVNWSEVVQKSLSLQVDVQGMQQDFSDAGVDFEPFTPSQAEIAARLWLKTHRLGLSLADRACLALAIEKNATVITADPVWSELDLDVDVRLIR